MAYSLIAHVEASPGATGGTTGSIDTSGADLIVIGASWYNPGGFNDATAASDSKSNTWTALSLQSYNPFSIRLWYSVNPTVGSGHTFTVNCGGNSIYPSIFAMTFSGVAATPLDQQNTNNNSGSGKKVTSGSITPTEDNELCVTMAGLDSSTSISVDSGFTAYTQAFSSGVAVAGGMAYKIQTTAAAVNPQWTGSPSGSYLARITSFKASAAAPKYIPPFSVFRRRNLTLRGM